MGRAAARGVRGDWDARRSTLSRGFAELAPDLVTLQETIVTDVPGNPNSADWDWPHRRIDYILVRCGLHGGPTRDLVADLELPPSC